MMRCESPKASRGGFTLVEMMVSVALVCLMLALFGEVFSIATKSMSKMKGVAENDQKARMLNVLIRGDIQSRSYRQVQNEQGMRALDAIDVDPNHKQITPFIVSACNGYFFISENDPNSQTDDVIQFTIDTSKSPNTFETPILYGRALQFGSDNNPFQPFPGDTSARDLLSHNPDQPVFDDQAGRYTTGALTSDQTGSSQFAEVCYFLRNGNLYRRQLLIRQPTDTSKTDSQPYRPDGTPLIPGNSTYGTSMIWDPNSKTGDWALSTGSFWGDFDYSAVYSNNRVHFLGTPDHVLDNVGTYPLSLGLSRNRFGFAPFITPSRSVEFTNDGNYLGRFTHLETSDPNFSWPGSSGLGADGNPYTADDTNPLTSPSTSMSNGVVTINGTTYNGTRVSQDLLMPNVHEFDVKVWDPAAANPLGLQGEFVDIGGTGAAYFASPNLTMAPNYGSGTATSTSWSNIWDTWTTRDAATSGGGAPFRFPGTQFGPDNEPGVAGVDDNGNGIFDQNDFVLDGFGNKIFKEQGWMGSDDLIYLRAIKIHIRYYDVPSDSMRDVTIIESFVE